jgi:glyoxalase family protein
VSELGNRFRYAVGNGAPGTMVDLVCAPEGPLGRVAVTVHHVAWRTATGEQQVQWRDTLTKLQYDLTPVIDRQYFHSIYFREPGAVLSRWPRTRRDLRLTSLSKALARA